MEPYYSDGQVTLYLGDCRDVTEWLAADVLVTDPPYGMNYRSGRVANPDAIRGDRDLAARDAALACWSSGRPALVFGTWKRPRPAGVRQVLIWDKRGGVGYSGDLSMPWADVCEEIYVIGPGWPGRRRPNILQARSLPSQSEARPDHPTPKPVSLMEQLVDACPPGTVADPFAGSGSTLVAARNLGRKAIGVEIEERYAEIAARRLAQDVLPLGVAP